MILLDEVDFRAGEFHLRGISFVVPRGSYAVLMGATGTGKSTLLRGIAGLLPALGGGRVELAGRDVTDLPPGARGIGYVPQDGALFPHMSVARHLTFGPRFQGWDAPRRTERARELAAELGIDHLLQRRPRGLSGGERQRVALGRALAAQPPVLLLDEPLSAVDEAMRSDLCDLLAALPARTGATVLHVTHSPAEAERLADLRLELEAGEVRRVGDEGP